MIKFFYGDDRLRANQAIKKFLGTTYEILDGVDLNPNDLPNIFLGASLFSSSRNILIRDLSSNKAVFDELPKYLGTPHQVAIFESKLDKRSATYKDLKNQIEFEEFALPPDPNFKLVFDIYKTAKQNGPQAIAMLAKIKPNEDPIMFFGLLVSQALKDFSYRQGSREKQILKELSKIDLQIKTTKFEPWLLVESFLLRLSSLS